MRLIDENSEQKGVVNLQIALDMARDAGLDLIEISPNAKPPVCKILDFGKFKYEIEKQLKLNKKKQHIIHVKEILTSFKCDEDIPNHMKNKLPRKVFEEKLRTNITLRDYYKKRTADCGASHIWGWIIKKDKWE